MSPPQRNCGRRSRQPDLQEQRQHRGAVGKRKPEPAEHEDDDDGNDGHLLGGHVRWMLCAVGASTSMSRRGADRTAFAGNPTACTGTADSSEDADTTSASDGYGSSKGSFMRRCESRERAQGQGIDAEGQGAAKAAGGIGAAVPPLRRSYVLQEGEPWRLLLWVHGVSSLPRQPQTVSMNSDNNEAEATGAGQNARTEGILSCESQ